VRESESRNTGDSESVRRAYFHDLFVTQSSEAPLGEFENLAGLCPVITRLSARVQWWSSLQAVALKVNLIGNAASGKKENVSSRIGVATVDGFSRLFVIEAGCNNKSSNS
jgi:hypothetical protein